MKKFFALAMTLLALVALTACDSSDYKAAAERMENGEYAAASEAFKALGDYEDSAAKAQACDYFLAEEARESGDYATAAERFKDLGAYEDSAAQARDCDYRLALAIFENGDYAAAITAFETLNGHEDSEEYLSRARDELLREELTGVWVYCYDIGKEAVGVLGEEMEELPEMPILIMDFELELKEDGNLSATVNEEKLRQDAEPFLNTVVAAMIDWLAAENGMEPEALCQALGVATTEELQTMLMEEVGLNADTFVEEILSDEVHFEGTWKVESGVFTASVDGETEKLAYDSAADTITMPAYKNLGESETISFLRR